MGSTMLIRCEHSYPNELKDLTPLKEKLVSLNAAYGFITKFNIQRGKQTGPTYRKHIAGHVTVFPNDVLTVELAGSAVAGDIEYVSMLQYYPELPGTMMRAITREELVRRAVNVFTVENTLALGTTGGYSGAEAINAEFDQFHAGGLYALIGYKVDVECASVAWRGADTGNLRVGGPGIETEPEMTADWFGRLSDAFKLPLIPVFSAENKGGILVDGVQDENGADVTVTSIFVELGK